jgi:hypothetical protein
MAEPQQFAFSHEELIELLIKRAGVHEGHWALMLGLNVAAGNFGALPSTPPATPSPAGPGLLVTVQSVVIQRVDEVSAAAPGAIFVDASQVNPAKKRVSGG